MNAPQAVETFQQETRTFTAVLKEWEAIEAQMKLLKAREMELRIESARLGFGFDPAVERKGTEYADLGNGWRAKAVFKMTATVDSATVNDVLDELEKTGAEGKFVAERVIKFDPKLSVSEYDKLSEAHRKIIDKCVTFKPGSPTLEIVAPKTKK